MPKYLIQKKDGQILQRFDRDPHPNWEVPVTEEVVELDESIPYMEVEFWKWTGKELVVDGFNRDRRRQFKSAYKWKQNQLPELNWGSLTKIEKKLILRKIGLTQPEENQLITEWVAAGEPEVV
jgi:hypothetical protein